MVFNFYLFSKTFILFYFIVYDIRPFNGKKTFTITTTTAMGQKNSVLIAAYFAGAFVCLVAIIVLFYLRYKDNKNKINWFKFII